MEKELTIEGNIDMDEALSEFEKFKANYGEEQSGKTPRERRSKNHWEYRCGASFKGVQGKGQNYGGRAKGP